MTPGTAIGVAPGAGNAIAVAPGSWGGIAEEAGGVDGAGGACVVHAATKRAIHVDHVGNVTSTSLAHPARVATAQHFLIENDYQSRVRVRHANQGRHRCVDHRLWGTGRRCSCQPSSPSLYVSERDAARGIP